jgi:hypothetical protein
MGKLIKINSGKFGIGTSALILSLIAIMFSFTSLDKKTIGQEILAAIGVRFPVMIISAILFVIAMFIGQIYRENYGAKIGRNISIFFIILIATLTVISK